MASNSDGNILIVDDQENWQKVLRHLLEERYNIQTSGNYYDAEKIISDSTFDLVVLDVRLVDEDIFNVSGLALLKKIKSKKPNTGIIVLTGYPDSVRQEMLQEYDADAFLFKVPNGKSFDIQEFKELVEKVVQKYKS